MNANLKIAKQILSKADELAKEEVSLYRLALIIILIHYVMIIVSKDIDITFTLYKIISTDIYLFAKIMINTSCP